MLPLLSAIRFSPGHILLVGLIYFGAARYGWMLAAAPTGVSPFWPPAGIALALLILWGRHVWPGILLGALAADVSLGLSSRSILVGAAANTIEPLAAATLLAKWPGFDSRLERPRDLTALLLSAALRHADRRPDRHDRPLACRHFASENGDGVPDAPVHLVARRRHGRARAGAAAAHLGTDAPVVAARASRGVRAAIGDDGGGAPKRSCCARRSACRRICRSVPCTPTPSGHSAIEYLPFPLIIWASMRFGVRGASAASLVLTASAVWHYSISPLERHHLGADANLLLLQTSIAVIVLTALVIGAVMTERDAVTRALDESRAKLQQKQHLESLGLLAGGVAHDFNNLLTGVLGSASLARQQIARHPASIHLREIENAAERAANLCRQMLAYAGQGRFQSQPLDLSAIVRDEIGALSRTMGGHITVTSDLPGHLPAVDADATQLRQVVTNLLLNASEAIKGDAGTIRVTTGLIIADRAHLATASPRARTRHGPLRLADDRRHRSRHERRHAVAHLRSVLHHEVHGTRPRPRGGARHRPQPSRRVVGDERARRGHHVPHPAAGDQCTRDPAGGARDQARADRAEPCPPAWPRASCVGLIVDDESSVRAVATRMLAACGLETLTASSGEEAVAVLEAHPGVISLVLLDLTMPAMNGEETYRRMRAIDRSVPVLLMSGYTEHEASTHFGGQGTSGFIQKPFRLDELKEAIRRVLRDDITVTWRGEHGQPRGRPHRPP